MNPAAPTVDNELISFEAPEPEPEYFEPTDTGSFELSPQDRRGKHRQVLRVSARISLDDEPPLDAHTIDLSAHGLAITSSQPLNVEQECNVELGVSVPELARPPALRASVRYCGQLRDGQYRIGLKFTNVSIEAAELLVAALEL